MTTGLTPSQQDVIDLLGAARGDRPSFPASLGPECKAALEDVAARLVALLPDDDTLYVSKRHLTLVHSCPARYLAEQTAPFEWSIPVARGTVAHKAIELSVFWAGEPTPMDLVEETIARYRTDGAGLGRWLQTLGPADLAELASEANARVAAFLECWPPLQRRWRPVLEAPVRVELAGGTIVLAGKVDLSLGRPEGNVAGKVLVDLKTGAFAPAHRDDLRFYALLDTIRLGTPPRRLASYYLDRGEFTPEDVTVSLIDAALARTSDAMEAMVELRAGVREPQRRPSHGCRFCPALADCAEGRRFLAGDDDAELDLIDDIDDDL